MRLATITNWAYGATVVLTLVSGTTMLLASNAQGQERAAVAQQHALDQATSRLDDEIYALSDYARQYVSTGNRTHLLIYRHELAALRAPEERTRHIRDAGASEGELAVLKDAVRWADTLHDEQGDAIASKQKGDDARAHQLVFGDEYERELERVKSMVEHFQYQLDQRTDSEVAAATRLAKLWRATSETALGITGLLFLCVLYFIFKRRVLRPVVRLSDVVSRLAAQDYAAEPPAYDQIDEIGDMAQAIRVFRETGLERQRLEEERNADRALRDLLSRMTQRLQGCDTLLDLKEVIQRFVPEIVPGFAGRLYLLDKSRNAMVEACNWLSPVHSRNEFAPIACWALRRGTVHRPAGETIDVPCDHLGLADRPLVDSICLPLTAPHETLGLLYFEPRQETPLDLRESPEAFLKMLAENIGLALANLSLRDTLRDLAMTDPLTGLANRRQLDMILEFQLAEADRLGQPISCLMIDVDHFKRFNDEFGHDAGDAVLREVGATLRQSSREQELAFRYGGEEFLMLLPALGPDLATERAEQVRDRIGALRVRHDGRELGGVTVSIGLASAPAHGPMDRLVQTADAALLRAKKLGRDRIDVATPRKGRAAA